MTEDIALVNGMVPGFDGVHGFHQPNEDLESYQWSDPSSSLDGKGVAPLAQGHEAMGDPELEHHIASSPPAYRHSVSSYSQSSLRKECLARLRALGGDELILTRPPPNSRNNRFMDKESSSSPYVDTPEFRPLPPPARPLQAFSHRPPHFDPSNLASSSPYIETPAKFPLIYEQNAGKPPRRRSGQQLSSSNDFVDIPLDSTVEDEHAKDETPSFKRAMGLAYQNSVLRGTMPSASHMEIMEKYVEPLFPGTVAGIMQNAVNGVDASKVPVNPAGQDTSNVKGASAARRKHPGIGPELIRLAIEALNKPVPPVSSRWRPPVDVPQHSVVHGYNPAEEDPAVQQNILDYYSNLKAVSDGQKLNDTPSGDVQKSAIKAPSAKVADGLYQAELNPDVQQELLDYYTNRNAQSVTGDGKVPVGEVGGTSTGSTPKTEVSGIFPITDSINVMPFPDFAEPATVDVKAADKPPTAPINVAIETVRDLETGVNNARKRSKSRYDYEPEDVVPSVESQDPIPGMEVYQSDSDSLSEAEAQRVLDSGEKYEFVDAVYDTKTLNSIGFKDSSKPSPEPAHSSNAPSATPPTEISSPPAGATNKVDEKKQATTPVYIDRTTQTEDVKARSNDAEVNPPIEILVDSAKQNLREMAKSGYNKIFPWMLAGLFLGALVSHSTLYLLVVAVMAAFYFAPDATTMLARTFGFAILRGSATSLTYLKHGFGIGYVSVKESCSLFHASLKRSYTEPTLEPGGDPDLRIWNMSAESAFMKVKNKVAAWKNFLWRPRIGQVMLCELAAVSTPLYFSWWHLGPAFAIYFAAYTAILTSFASLIFPQETGAFFGGSVRGIIEGLKQPLGAVAESTVWSTAIENADMVRMPG